jgi:rhodanese-related sulfurtransferase
MNASVGIAVVAAVATAGDYVWYSFGVRHTMVAGLLHGVVLLTVVGAVLGSASGHTLKGLPIGALAGLGGAASYYLLVAVMDGRTYGTAIPAAWVIMWLLLAALDGRWLRAPTPRTWFAVGARGLTAAILGGVAFYLVLNVLWGRPPAEGRSYLLQFAAWAFAWTPGLLALMIGGTSARARAGTVPLSSPVSAGSEPDVVADATISGRDLMTRIDRGDVLHILDVRSPGEFEAGHVPGAVNIPFTQVLSRMGEVPGNTDAELILYCGHGPRAYMAAAALRQAGRGRIVYLSGHWASWQNAGLRVESGSGDDRD